VQAGVFEADAAVLAFLGGGAGRDVPMTVYCTDAVLTVARTNADGIVMPAARGARRVRRPEVLIIVHQLLGGLPWCQSAPDRGYGPYPARPPARRSACLRVGRRKPPSLLVDEPRC